MSLPFTNRNISPDELPTIETVEFHPLEPDFLKVERISIMITLTIILVVGGTLYMIFDNLVDMLLVIPVLFAFLIFAAFLFISTEISFKLSGYALREKDIIYRSGWIIRKERIVMLNRIQHVSVQSGPIERNFGLSSVSLYTAGASDADFTIKGIRAQTASQIKEWISNRLNGERS